MQDTVSGATDSVELDSYDIAILTALSNDAELTTIELSKLVHLSRTAVARRISNLRDRGVLGTTRVDIRFDRIGFPIRAFVEISAPNHDSFDVRDKLLGKPEVLNLSVVLGAHLVVVEVIAVDTRHLHQFLTWINDLGYSETKVILQQHFSNMGIGERMKMISRDRATVDVNGANRSRRGGC